MLIFTVDSEYKKYREMSAHFIRKQRPQQLNSPIPGRIIKWYVKNGDYVKKGDTLLQLSEVKEDYLDPLLVKRTEQQVEAKKGVRDYYEAKVGNH